MSLPQVDLSKPKYDQSTYLNRAKHFFLVTNPLNILATNSELERAKRIVLDYKAGKAVPDVKTVEELWKAKYLYDSAFHPDTGEKMILVGRMSAQMPMNALINGGMLTFYKTTRATIFWQWFNQTFNAIVNYTNRSGATPISTKQLGISYVLATSGAITAALSLNRLTRSLPPLIGRFVPFVAVATANAINIPLMRNVELQEGLELYDDHHRSLDVKSDTAAVRAITEVVFSRILMAVPGMILTPIIVQKLTNKGVFKRHPWSIVPIQVGIVGVILIFATPLGCACFQQISPIQVSKLPQSEQEMIRKKNANIEVAYYNKGL